MLLTKHTPEGDKEKRERTLLRQLSNFILEKDYPCERIKTVFSQGKVKLKSYRVLGSIEAAEEITTDLKTYISEFKREYNTLTAFIAVFINQKIEDKDEFDRLLLQQLKFIKQCDQIHDAPPVNPVPGTDNYCLSIVGKPFHIIGLHPKEERETHQAPYPCLAFIQHLGSFGNKLNKSGFN